MWLSVSLLCTTGRHCQAPPSRSLRTMFLAMDGVGLLALVLDTLCYFLSQ